MKFSTSFKSYISAITEAIALTSLKKVPGVQWLVGVCPEQALMVTHYGGPILRDWYHPAVVVLPKEWVEIAIEIVKAFMDIHSCNLVHNDIKCNNICVSRAQGGFKVTVIDFGLSKKEGQRIRLSGFW